MKKIDEMYDTTKTKINKYMELKDEHTYLKNKFKNIKKEAQENKNKKEAQEKKNQNESSQTNVNYTIGDTTQIGESTIPRPETIFGNPQLYIDRLFPNSKSTKGGAGVQIHPEFTQYDLYNLINEQFDRVDKILMFLNMDIPVKIMSLLSNKDKAMELLNKNNRSTIGDNIDPNKFMNLINNLYVSTYISLEDKQPFGKVLLKCY